MHVRLLKYIIDINSLFWMFISLHVLWYNAEYLLRKRLILIFWQNVEKMLLAVSYISVCLPVRLPACTSAWNNSAPTERIFVKFDVWKFFKNLARKFKFYWNLTRITDNLHEDLYTFMITSRSFLLRIKNVSDRICRQNQNTHFVFYNIPPPPYKIVSFMRQYGKIL